jgi:hypothetical protein
MTLFEKLRSIYPSLTINDFTTDGTILIGSDEEGNELIESWTHPTLVQPTEEELAKFI